MNAFSRILVIIKEGVGTFSKSSEGNKRNALFVPIFLIITPLLLSIAAYIVHWDITPYVENLLNILSIFAGMIFAIIFLLPERVNSMLTREQSGQTVENDAIIGRLRAFEKMIIYRMSFFLVTIIILIFLLFASTMASNIPLRIISAISAFFLYWFLWLLLSLVSTIHILNLNK